MGRIDPGPFGNYTAPAVRRGRAPGVIPAAYDTTGGLDQAAQALQGTSDTIAREAAIERERARIEAERAREAADRAAHVEEATRARRDQIQLREEAGNYARALASDQSVPDAEKAQVYDEWLSQRRKDLEPTYKLPDILGQQQANIDEIGVLGRGHLQEGITRANQAKTAANVAQTIESLGRQALDNRDAEPSIQEAFNYIDKSAAAAGWDALEVQKQKAYISETWTESVVAARVNEDPAGALEALRSGEYERLDPKVRNALTGNAEAELERRAMRARVEAEARASRAGRFVSQLGDIWEKGLQPDANMVATAAALAKGTEFEGIMTNMQARAKDRAAFAVMPIAEQAKQLAAMEAAYTNPAIGATGDEAWDLAWRQRQHEATLQDIKTRGVGAAAAARGVVQWEPLNLADADALAAGLAARRDVIDVASHWAGQQGGMFSPDEMRGFNEALRRLPANEQRGTIEAVARVVGDPVKFRATMMELAPTNGAAASAGRLLVSDEPGARDAADLILKGEAYLNPPGQDAKPLVRLPTDTNMARSFDDITGDLYASKPQARGMAYDNTRRIYAALSADEGEFTQEASEVSSKRMKRAIEIATGGIGEYKGAPVVLPRGMDEGTFTSRVEARLLEASQAGRIAQKLSDSQLLDLELENAPTGYYVRQGGAYLLDARTGAKLKIDPYSAPVDWAAAARAKDPNFDMPPPPAPDGQEFQPGKPNRGAQRLQWTPYGFRFIEGQP